MNNDDNPEYTKEKLVAPHICQTSLLKKQNLIAPQHITHTMLEQRDCICPKNPQVIDAPQIQCGPIYIAFEYKNG